MILVFGSNRAGRHGKGAALDAYRNHGAKFGIGEGHVGNSYGVPTKDGNLKTLKLNEIMHHVVLFIMYAEANPKLTFKVTRIGCGLAGLNDWDMAPMFEQATNNCQFDNKWKLYLGDSKEYWGTY